MTLSPGTRLGPYEIVAPVGAGGMGEVYRGRDTRLGRTVAVKILPAEFANDAAFKIRFDREAKAISALNHPHICTLYDVGDSYLVMEYCEGRTLTGPMPIDQVLEYGIQIAEALEKAHRSGIVHRDLKPSNIMITESGVKLLDFGLAKQFSDSSTTLGKATQDGHVVGTLQYMAPEVLGGRDADPRSDVYALGLVLYEMATGRRAATSTQAAPNAPLERVIRGCLVKDPERRTQTAHDVVTQLRWVREGRTRISPTAMKRTAAVLAALAIAAGAWWAWEHGQRSAAPMQSLVVLPFENAAGADDDYLVDAIHDGIIGELSQLSGIRLISRTSAMHFKNAKKTIPEIARELDVDGVVEGSVVNADRDLRIHVELVRARPREQTVWSRVYERTRGDAATVQLDVVRALAQATGAVVTADERSRLARPRNLNPEVYEAYTKGMYHVRKLTPEEAQKGLQYLQQAVAADPNDASAHAGLALAYSILTHAPAASEEEFTRAKTEAQRAIALDDTLGEAHAALGSIALFHDWNWTVADRELRRALALDPNLAQAHRDYAWFLQLRGPGHGSIEEMQRAKQLDPLTPLYTSDLGWMYLYPHRFSDAIREFRSAAELEPSFDQHAMGIIVALSELGRFDEAIASANRVPPNSAIKHFAMAYALGRAGRLEEAKREIADAAAHPTRMTPWGLTYACAAIGDRDDAIRWIEKGIETRVSFILWVYYSPALQTLHGDPRFEAQIRRLNLPSSP